MDKIIMFIKWFFNALEEVILEKLAIFETDRDVRMRYAIINDHSCFVVNEYGYLMLPTDRDLAVENGIIHN